MGPRAREAMKSAKKLPARGTPGRKAGAKAKAVSAKKRKRSEPTSRPAKGLLKIPPILLEGDDPPLAIEEPGLELSATQSSAQVEIVETPAAAAVIPVLGAAPGDVEKSSVEPSAEAAPRAEPRSNVVEVSVGPVAEAARAAIEPVSTPEPELPEAYGTGRLALVARDTHWLYAHWDLTREQLDQHKAASPAGHLVLRIHQGGLETPSEQEIALHSDSTHWFLPVDRAGTGYAADLGWYGPGHSWRCVANSGLAFTPPEQAAEPAYTHFATIPADMPLLEFRDSGSQREEFAKPGPSEPAVAVEPQSWVAESAPPPPSEVTPNPFEGRFGLFSEREEALARLVSLEVPFGEPWGLAGTHKSPEHPVVEAPSSVDLAGPGPSATQRGPGSGGREAPSSAVLSVAAPVVSRGFWFNINAELVIYGATEADARLEIGGHTVPLRPDGTFSLRFALPDGDYELPVMATSADGLEAREARLRFGRHTLYHGAVGVHPQEDGLRPPAPENVR